MKKLFYKKTREILQSVLLILCTIMGFLVMAENKDIAGGSYNIWIRALASITDYTGEFILLVAMILSIIVNTITIILSIVGKKDTYILGIIWTIITIVVFFIVNGIYSVYTSASAIYIILAILFIVIAVTYYVACLIICPDTFRKKQNQKNDYLKDVRITITSKIFIVVCCFICIAASLTSLFIPLVTIKTSSSIESVNPIFALTNPKGASVTVYISFVSLFIVNLINIALIFSTLSYIKYDDGIYIKKSRLIIYLNYIVSVIYFLVGLSIVFFVYRTSSVQESSTVAYIPFIIMSIVMVVFSIASVNLPITKKDKSEKKFPKFEMLIYTILFVILPIISIFLKLIVVKLNNVEQISIKLFDLIKDHSSLSDSYQLIDFFAIIFLTLVLSLFVLTVTSFFKNKNLFYKFAMNSILVDMLFIFAIGTFGLYYQMVQGMNEEKLSELLATYGFSYSSLNYEVTSQTIYIFLIGLALLILVLIRNPLKDIPAGEYSINTTNGDTANSIDQQSYIPQAEENLPGNQDEGLVQNNGAIGGYTSSEPLFEDDEEEEIVNKLPDFDACPAFSELDGKIQEFEVELKSRQAKQFGEPSLVSLVQFIVDYARESRLHLSYSVEDIATFIAGLGACRLSILQGMSGTGKTSLPKIFLEAIMGNCEIIEVESSWRDKNELLGYYNEFSKTFTPKKFTQALYKAKLNESVPTFIVLDEMNLSRIEYYFSDFLSLMENEEGKREIKLLNVKLYNVFDNEKHSYHALSEDHTIKIPSNIWFIGTANRDESTFEISDKVYDRAHTMNFNKRAPKAKFTGETLEQRYLPYDVLANLLSNAKSTYEFDIDKNNVIKEVERILSPYNISFGNRISGQIENFVKVYCSCFDNPKEREFEAVERILLSKVVAKLENKSVENKEILIAEFNKLKLKKCVEFVSKLNED